MARLGDICEKGTSNVAQKDLSDKDGDYPIYGASGLIKKVNFYHQDKPYIAIVKDGAGAGRVMQLPAKSSVIGTLQYIIPKNNFCIGYLAYAIEHMNLSKYCLGAAIPHIYFKDYCNEILPDHSLAEQQRIASQLDKISHLIALRKRQLSKLDELVKSRFVEMFGDMPNSTKMAEVCSLITDGTHQSPKFVESGIPFLFVSNVVSNRLTYDAEKFIDEATYEELIKRTPIEIGDVLLSTVGSYGHPAIVNSDRRFLFQRHIAYLKPRKEIVDSQFLHGAILSASVQEQIERKVKGIAQKTLNLSEIKTIMVPLPPLALQREFAAFVAKVDKLAFKAKASLEKLETLKKAMMQKYFN